MFEIVVEADDAVNFGARKAQRRGDWRHGAGRNPSEFVLNPAQNQEQRTRPLFEIVDNGGDLRLIPWMTRLHHDSEGCRSRSGRQACPLRWLMVLQSKRPDEKTGPRGHGTRQEG